MRLLSQLSARRTVCVFYFLLNLFYCQFLHPFTEESGHFSKQKSLLILQIRDPRSQLQHKSRLTPHMSRLICCLDVCSKEYGSGKPFAECKSVKRRVLHMRVPPYRLHFLLSSLLPSFPPSLSHTGTQFSSPRPTSPQAAFENRYKGFTLRYKCLEPSSSSGLALPTRKHRNPELRKVRPTQPQNKK